MKSRILAPLGLLAFGIFLLSGCDAGGFKSDQEGQNQNVSRIDTPILFNIEEGGENLCVGQEITLVGVNFSDSLEANNVRFRFQNARIPGLPTRIEFPTDGNPKNGLESRLKVLVPTGVATGNIELEVDGTFAGSASYFACPQIVSYGIGANAIEPRLMHGGPLGFVDTIPPIIVVLFGLNFDEVDRILVSDSQGGAPITVPQNQINLRPIAKLPANNLQQIGFSLSGLNLAVQGQRDNITVQVGTPKYLSNQVQVPVANSTDAATNPGIGPVINGTLVPPGVRTGPVRIRYCLYDYPILDQAHTIEVDWTIDAGENWYPALPIVNVKNPTNPSLAKIRDPEHDGNRQILPGSMEFGSPAGILYSGGELRTFTWDAQNDEKFREFNNTAGVRPTGRNFVLYFRIHPSPEIDVEGKPSNPNHFFVTPPVSYYDVEDRGTRDNSVERMGEFFDDFSTNSNEDTTSVPDSNVISARWGPPYNSGTIRGEVPSVAPAQAGTGTFDLAMRKAAPPPDNLVSENYLVYAATTGTGSRPILRIDHIVVVNDVSQNPPVPQTISQTIFPTLDSPNPGEDVGEFHVRTLFVESGMQVFLEGNLPIVFRVSGAEIPLAGQDCALPDDCTACRQFCKDCADQRITVCIAGVLTANGNPGGAPVPATLIPPFPGAPGAGGEARCGGGNGGRGAEWLDWPGFNGDTPPLTRAQDGANDGGGGGSTGGAVDPIIANTSRFIGAPGGGGGNLYPGGAGDVGTIPTPGNFTPPRGGRAGPMRGNSHLLPLSAGSGGGGGGATIKRDPNPTPATPAMPVHGGGGGGGGGAIQITASGNMVFGDIIVNGVKTPNIQARGGDGGRGGAVSAAGTGNPESGAGGGGSGGCILLQASGYIDVDGDSLDVRGGLAGSMGQRQSTLPYGEGEGSPGRIRIEPRLGGGPPFASSLACEAALTENMTNSTAVSTVVKVNNIGCFPSSGRVLIDKEVIYYRSVIVTGAGVGNLGKLTRGWEGTTVVTHTAGAKVVLLDSVVTPLSGLVTSATGSQYFEDPDPILGGSGADGVLHVRFIETTDPDTGLPMVDPVTGNPLSLWLMDTDTGTVLDPLGTIMLISSTAGTDMGLLLLTQLRIDPNVTLRIFGSRSLRIQVTEVADIGGTIDLSGFDGGLLQFDVNNTSNPLPGLGGKSGPGGGDGGDGGSMVFIDGDLTNKDPSNNRPIPGGQGGLPAFFPPEYDRTGFTSGAQPPPDDLVGLETTRATAGDPLRDKTTCGGTLAVPCTAGGGGGGGARTAGSDGEARPTPNTVFGRGGSIFALDSCRFGGQRLLLGGQGGAGGGASYEVSDDYKNKRAGPAAFQGAAKFGPGTGGGGGGGALNLVVQGALILRSTGAILARGGDAYQSIDWAGNGGAGAGGTVLIQIANSFTVEPGALIDVNGGLANQAPPGLTGDQLLPLYEGNIRRVGAETQPRVLGGLGGNGANGRVRIEVIRGSNLLKTTFNETISSSYLLLDGVPSVGVSESIPMGVGPGFMTLSHMLISDGATLRFIEQGIPEGTDAFIVWKGAGPSMDVHGLAGTLKGGVENVSDLQDLEYVSFSIHFISNGISRETPTVTEVRLPVRLDNPANH